MWILGSNINLWEAFGNRKVHFYGTSCSHNLECDYICICTLLNKKRNFLIVKAVWRWNELSWKVMSSQLLEVSRNAGCSLTIDDKEGFLSWFAGQTKWFLLSFATRVSTLQWEKEASSLRFPSGSHRVQYTVGGQQVVMGMSEWLLVPTALPDKSFHLRTCYEQAVQTQQWPCPPWPRLQGHPVTLGQLSAELAPGCVKRLKPQPLTSAPGLSLWCFRFPLASSWLGCSFPSQSSRGSSRFHTIFQDTAETTTSRVKPCGSLGTCKLFSIVVFQNRALSWGNQAKWAALFPAATERDIDSNENKWIGCVGTGWMPHSIPKVLFI